MNDMGVRYCNSNEPQKKKWVVQKMPIKGGTVLRSAMVVEIFRAEIKWIEIEDVVIA